MRGYGHGPYFCDAEHAAGVDTRPGFYYVSVIDGPRRALLAGPWAHHRDALAHVRAVNELACSLDPRAHWFAYGTARVDPDEQPPVGRLNDKLGYPTNGDFVTHVMD